ncbi:MAG: DUF5991 domain-containing protein [bacterium]|nr:DUF5991 domain-containing protein [bacterium]
MKRAVVSLVFAFALASVSLAQGDWVGTYSFDEDGGRNAGGTAIFIVHELVVMETDDGSRATLKSNGYQTSKDLNCTAQVKGSKLEIYFESYGEDNVFETYSPGDLLLTLENKTAKGKSEVLTWWGKFTPIVPEKPKTGKVFFVKTKKFNIN